MFISLGKNHPFIHPSHWNGFFGWISIKWTHVVPQNHTHKTSKGKKSRKCHFIERYTYIYGELLCTFWFNFCYTNTLWTTHKEKSFSTCKGCCFFLLRVRQFLTLFILCSLNVNKSRNNEFVECIIYIFSINFLIRFKGKTWLFCRHTQTVLNIGFLHAFHHLTESTIFLTINSICLCMRAWVFKYRRKSSKADWTFYVPIIQFTVNENIASVRKRNTDCKLRVKHSLTHSHSVRIAVFI